MPLEAVAAVLIPQQLVLRQDLALHGAQTRAPLRQEAEQGTWDRVAIQTASFPCPSVSILFLERPTADWAFQTGGVSPLAQSCPRSTPYRGVLEAVR